MLRSTAVTAVATALVAFGGCGDDNDSRSESSAAGSAERYCALTRELDAAGGKFFAELERDENATPADYEAAERRFVEAQAAKFAELQRATPQEIRTDVQTLLNGQRARAGLAPDGAVDEAELTAAEKRVRAFEKRSCEA